MDEDAPVLKMFHINKVKEVTVEEVAIID